MAMRVAVMYCVCCVPVVVSLLSLFAVADGRSRVGAAAIAALSVPSLTDIL